jgi:hypothetical protein
MGPHIFDSLFTVRRFEDDLDIAFRLEYLFQPASNDSVIVSQNCSYQFTPRWDPLPFLPFFAGTFNMTVVPDAGEPAI